LVSALPGNSREFQAHADLSHRIEKTAGFFGALAGRAMSAAVFHRREAVPVRILTYTVPPEEGGRLLRRLVRGRMGVSQHVFSSLKVRGGVLVDGAPARADQAVCAGQVISVVMRDEASGIPPDFVPVDVVYEDEDMLIVSKPAPLPCQASRGRRAWRWKTGWRPALASPTCFARSTGWTRAPAG
jgi:23S rRNA pseudouridine1911/1915/1917 synthase